MQLYTGELFVFHCFECYVFIFIFETLLFIRVLPLCVNQRYEIPLFWLALVLFDFILFYCSFSSAPCCWLNRRTRGTLHTDMIAMLSVLTMALGLALAVPHR